MLGYALLVGAGGDFSAVLGADGERVLPELVSHLFPAVIVGLYVAAVLAARRPEARPEALMGMSRRTTLALAALALMMALMVSIISPDRTIFWYAIFGWSGIGATFCPVIVLALLWPRYNVWGALASMITGAFCVPLFKFAVPLIPVWGPIVSQAEELAPSFLLALVAGMLATLATHDRTGDAALPS